MSFGGWGCFSPDNKTRGLAPTDVFPFYVYSPAPVGAAGRALPASTALRSCLFVVAGETCVEPLPAPHADLWASVQSWLRQSTPSILTRLWTSRSKSSLCSFSVGRVPGMGLPPSLSLKTQSQYFSDFMKHLLPPIFSFCSPPPPPTSRPFSPPFLCLTSWPIALRASAQCLRAVLGSRAASLPGLGRPPTPSCFSSICHTVVNRWSQKEPEMACPPSPIIQTGS